jgi:hypothetical protein
MDWDYLWELLKGVFWNSKTFLLSIPAYIPILLFLYSLWGARKEEKVNWITHILRDHPALISMSILLVYVILVSHSLYVHKTMHFATPEALISPILKDMNIRISDLAREDMRIRNKTFINCHIYGPAIVFPIKGNTFDHVGFVEVDPDGAFIETTNVKVSGAIGFENCVIKDCMFHKIGFIGSPERIKQAREQILSLDMSDRLQSSLMNIHMNEEKRLNKEYPLGYAMIAFSGEKQIAVPYTEQFEADWNHLSVTKDRNNFLQIGISRLYDKKNDHLVNNVGLGVRAVPGARSAMLEFASFTIVVECLRSEPVGIYAVLGFSEG